MKKTKPFFVILLVVIILVLSVCTSIYFWKKYSGFGNLTDQAKTFLENQKEIFPFRLLCDENRNYVPFVALTAFFRTDADRQRYKDFLSHGIEVIGYTSYKTFPKPISDGTGDQSTVEDPFEYTGEIKTWVVCFKNLEEYGFTNTNNLLEMSESDFKDPVPPPYSTNKQYDCIYSCLQDDDNSCPLDGWNAVNRNFNLALKCFPIMVKEFNLKILVVGRLHCGLEELYPNNITVVNMLPYHEFQENLKNSKFLFIPNIYDASPRVVTEAISNNVPVLMNRSIVCGSKYITPQTGVLFTDEYDIRGSLKKMNQLTTDISAGTVSPASWWSEHYNVSDSGTKFRNFLHAIYPGRLDTVKEVRFY
jgi:hypothetical protein